MCDCDKNLEQELEKVKKEKEEADKLLLIAEWVIGILSIIVLLVPVFIGALAPMADWLRFFVVFSGFVPGLIGLFFTVKIEQIAGYYECQHCKHKYVPEYKDMILSMHMGRTRFMCCPKCEKHSWQKKKINK